MPVDQLPDMTRRRIIEAGWVVTMDAGFSVIRNGAVVIAGDRIEAVGPAAEFSDLEGERESFPHHVLLPGLVNSHTHVVGALFRGLLEDRADSFYGFALPMEKFLNEESTYALSALGVAELALSGCTVMNDMFHYAAETARAVERIGIRAQIAHKTFDCDLGLIAEGKRVFDLDQGMRRLADNVALYESWNGAGDGRVQIRFGIHAADTVSPELMRAVLAESRPRGAGIHTHVAQSTTEVGFLNERYGVGSVRHLYNNDVLAPDTVAAHLLYADEDGVELLAATGNPVTHSPACVTKAVGIIGPYRSIYESGVRVGWGTDWITMDPWDAMRFGVVGYRMTFGGRLMLTDGNPVITARDALWRFTMGSAEILGIADQVGSLEPGKKADLILMDADQPHLAPMFDPITALVYNASGRDVTHVMVDGTFIVVDRNLTTADVHELIQQAQDVASAIWAAGATPEQMSLHGPALADTALSLS